MSGYVIGALIGAGAVLAGAGVAAMRDAFARRAERRAARRAELISAAREYLAALDVIAITAADMQPPRVKIGPISRLINRMVDNTIVDLFSFVFARVLARATAGRRSDELTDRVTLAATQLRLIAPESVLAIIRDIEDATRPALNDGVRFRREWDAIRDDVRDRFRRELQV